jgi:hypothetical protein
MPRTDALDQHTHRWLSVACSSLSDWHHLVGAYGTCSEIKLANPEIQLMERGFHRPQHAGRAGLRLRPARVEEEGQEARQRRVSCGTRGPLSKTVEQGIVIHSALLYSYPGFAHQSMAWR